MRIFQFRFFLLCTIAIVIAYACQPKNATALAGSNVKMKSLFNGKNLKGWDGDTNWVVENGAIHGKGRGQTTIWTKDDYDNFRLIVTSRMLEINKDHLGILFWGARPQKGNYKSKGFIQVQPPNGSMWDYVINKDAKPTRIIPNPRLPYTEWSTIEILANLSTGEIRMASNGVEQIYYKASDSAVWKKGPIGMQQHGKGIIEYKDILIEVNPKENRLITVK